MCNCGLKNIVSDSYAECCYPEFRYAECHGALVFAHFCEQFHNHFTPWTCNLS
jgi:hypothetical protein